MQANITVFTLLSLMMCQSAEDLRHQALWDGARGKSRMHLLSELSSKQPSLILRAASLTLLRIHIPQCHDS